MISFLGFFVVFVLLVYVVINVSVVVSVVVCCFVFMLFLVGIYVMWGDCSLIINVVSIWIGNVCVLIWDIGNVCESCVVVCFLIF